VHGYDRPKQFTQELINQHTDIAIAEAAFRWDNCFVRVDILEKHGDVLHLIEVKAKSCDGTTDNYVDRKGKIKSEILPYLYDVAFQKYVVQQAMPGYQVKASLMMADKTKCADIDHLNQLFAIEEKVNGEMAILVADDAHERIAQSRVKVLTALDVDELCDRIIRGETTEQMDKMGMPFKDFVTYASTAFARDERLVYPHDTRCFSCEFRQADSDLADGHNECMRREAGFKESDFARPLLEQLWGGGRAPRGKWLKNEGIYFMDQITEDHYSLHGNGAVGLDAHERTWLQIALATNNEDILSHFQSDIQDGTYLDRDGLRQEMATWQYPLHMIDFETTAVALPMYKGLRPYEQVAFQFSHHIIERTNDGGYTIRHAGQYLNEDVNLFPNFEFVRRLRDELSQDNGTIFRYAAHENTILRAIYRQLDVSEEPDKDELMTFIDSITKTSDGHVGERNMVDLLDVVKRYFYHYDEMRNSNSIKVVLPAVLNTSQFLMNKYQQPIYGSTIPSLNISASDPIRWVEFLADGRVDNPYHLLPPVSSFMPTIGGTGLLMEDGEEGELTIANGGAALTAYSKLMFCKGADMNSALRTALLRYCELDTMAMVFIWEYFYSEV
jgi:DNA-binding FrmR family transcriptional regulator